MNDLPSSIGASYGIDIGGSKIELVAFDASLQPVFRHRIDTPRHDYADFLDAVSTLVDRADDALGERCAAVGIGLPGIRERSSGRQLSANVPALTGCNVGADLSARLQRPLALGNDLQCFALSEANGGAGEGYPCMVGAILGTGAGGGYCYNGYLLGGLNGIAGEWGHWAMPAHLLTKHSLPLLHCGCGRQGCMERYVSGSGLATLHRHFGGISVDGAAVITAAGNGEPAARHALDVHLDLLGHTFACLIMALDPHAIVLGGGLSQHSALYQSLPGAIQQHLFQGVQAPPILAPRFGDAGGARGAALLTRQLS